MKVEKTTKEDLEEKIAALETALRNLVSDCPTSLSCDNFNHRKKGDLHDAEEDCPPCCRYYKALSDAQELLD